MSEVLIIGADGKERTVSESAAKALVGKDLARYVLQSLRFVVGHGIYNSGEIAGFNSLQAKKLLALGVAVPIVKSQPDAKSSTSEPAPKHNKGRRR